MNLDKFLQDFYSEYTDLCKNNRKSEAIWACEYLAVQALNCLGLAYVSNLKNHSKSIETFNNALQIDPGNWQLMSNLTHVYSVMEKNDLAIDKALKTVEYSKGEFCEPFYNAGVVLMNEKRLVEAEEMYKKALQINPHHATTAFNLSLTLLRQGKIQEGFSLYDWRYKSSEITGQFKDRFKIPEWDGSKFKKKTLIIYSEQGLGDFIFFSRFIKNIKKLGGKIICEVQQPIFEIIKDNIDVDEVVSRPNNTNWPPVPAGDFAISVCSLPKVLKINNLNQVKSQPYIKSTKNIKIKGASRKMKIGICWGGNSDHQSDYMRSMHVSSMKALTLHKKVQCYSLMKGVSPKRTWPCGSVDLNEGIESMNIISLDEKLNNFTDLAGIIESLDLVITVDTGLAHLCGAMGKPVWILLGKINDWRWMDNTDSSSWYESARLFRYKTSWEDLIQEVIDNLP